MKNPTVSLIIPTKDSRQLLSRHIEDLVDIASVAIEVIVIDSSKDASTLDYLREHLPASHSRFIPMEPGLYQAWNFAIQQAKGDYLAIATSGDRLDLANFNSLLAAAIESDADVTVGPPRFLSEDGKPVTSQWPIHRYLKASGKRDDHPLDAALVARWNTLMFPSTLIGSSANNLYRTSFLQQHPFPTDCGPQGDAVWAAMHCIDARWAVSPGSVSDFVIHETAPVNPSTGRIQQSFQLARIREHFETHGSGMTPDSAVSSALRCLELANDAFELRDEVKRRRKSPLWFLNPRSLQLRAKHKAMKKRMAALIEEPDGI